MLVSENFMILPHNKLDDKIRNTNLEKLNLRGVLLLKDRDRAVRELEETFKPDMDSSFALYGQVGVELIHCNKGGPRDTKECFEFEADLVSAYSAMWNTYHLQKYEQRPPSKLLLLYTDLFLSHEEMKRKLNFPLNLWNFGEFYIFNYSADWNSLKIEKEITKCGRRAFIAPKSKAEAEYRYLTRKASR